MEEVAVAVVGLRVPVNRDRRSRGREGDGLLYERLLSREILVSKLIFTLILILIFFFFSFLVKEMGDKG